MTLYLWSETAADNNDADPSINWREGQAPSTVNNSARAEMAAVKKWYNDEAGIIATGGSSTAYTATSHQGYDANGDGHVITVEMHATSGASPTLNVDLRGAQAILTATGGSAPPAGSLLIGSIQRFTDNGTNWVLNGGQEVVGLPLTSVDIIGGTQLTAPAIDDTLAIYDLSATANRRILISDFYKTLGLITAETAIALDDLLPLFDTSASLPKAMTPVNLLKVLNLLTEDTTPDTAADFLLSYDASASTVKKVKPQNASTVRQVLTTTYALNADLTTVLPYDDSTPTSAEGTSILSQAITLAATASRVKLDVTLWGSNDGAGDVVAAALFRGTTCINAVAVTPRNSNEAVHLGFTHVDSPATAGAVTYSVRVGPGDTNTVRLNGNVSGRKFGGTSVATLVVTELVV